MERECMGKINSYCQRNKLQLDYVTVDMKGPSHDPEDFVLRCRVKMEQESMGKINNYCQKTKLQLDYVKVKSTGPSHDPEDFVLRCRVKMKQESMGKINNYCQKTKLQLDYVKVKSTGPSHDPEFKVVVKIDNVEYGSGSAKSKKEAKELAAKKTWEMIEQQRTGQNSAIKSSRFLKDYKNIEPIGEGGFGNVFKATAKTDEMIYAIKRVELKEKVKREVQGLARLRYKYVVQYYCSWEGLDYMTYTRSRQKSETKIPCLFIQIEFCEQGTLKNWIENNRLKQKYNEMALKKFLQILKGVNYIHSKGLIHRDLKPQNIFISHDGKIKIGDFGLVTSMACESLTENQGTKLYMAPEQFCDNYGKEVDIYALGLICFEILSALVSHHEKNVVWHNVREGKFPEDFTKQFKTQASIIRRMLSKDASKRPCAFEIFEHLKRAAADNSLKAQ
nr:interferon-induced, double-stranded RNA-activated protein kinase isoform X3 [Anas platyrhynchos]